MHINCLAIYAIYLKNDNGICKDYERFAIGYRHLCATTNKGTIANKFTNYREQGSTDKTNHEPTSSSLYKTNLVCRSVCSRSNQQVRNEQLKMNKYIILLLVVCLVSVNAFVKRDAPPPASDPSDILEKIKTQVADTMKNINFDTIQKGFEDAMGNVKEALEKLKPTETPKA